MKQCNRIPASYRVEINHKGNVISNYIIRECLTIRISYVLRQSIHLGNQRRHDFQFLHHLDLWEGVIKTAIKGAIINNNLKKEGTNSRYLPEVNRRFIINAEGEKTQIPRKHHSISPSLRTLYIHQLIGIDVY